MIVGYHNFATCGRIIKWWKKPLGIFSRCQNRAKIEDLIKDNMVYDLRVFWNQGEPTFCHGFVEYTVDYSLDDVIAFIAEHKDCIVRLILERKDNVDWFYRICEEYEKKYPQIIFIGGRAKEDWKLIYDFGNSEYDNLVYQPVSSMDSRARWYEKILPRVFYNRVIKGRELSNVKDGYLNLMDFV
jgi:hypothetical protein